MSEKNDLKIVIQKAVEQALRENRSVVCTYYSVGSQISNDL